MKTAPERTIAIAHDGYDLVRGEFTPEDAKDILDHMISKKINFHKVRSFNSEIRLGKKDPNSELRISELMVTKEELLAILESAQLKGSKVHIKANISIDIEE